MADLATVPFARSLPNDWRIAAHGQQRVSQRPLASSVLIKLGRRVDLEPVNAKLDHALPVANCCIAKPECSWLWQGPKEWLVLSDVGDAVTQLQRLRAVLNETTAVALDITDRTLCLRVVRHLAMQLFAKGTSLNASLLTEGACYRTRFANLHATILRSGVDDFELITDRANAVYLHSWLRRSAQDLGVE